MKRFFSNRAFRYVFWSGIATAINIVLFYILLYLRCNYVISNILSYCLAALVSYFMNRELVFGRGNKVKYQFERYVVVRVLSILIDTALLCLMVEIADLNPYFAKIIVCAIVMLFTYCLNRDFVFTKGKEKMQMKRIKWKRKSSICPICGISGDFETFLARDYNRGGEEEFEYRICDSCGCMYLHNIPGDLSDYYGDSYYSFSMTDKTKGLISRLMEKRDRWEIAHHGVIGYIMHRFIPRPAYGVIGSTERESAILDIGCGDGYLLKLLEKIGYSNLTGCDRYMKEYGDNGKVKFINGTINICEGPYDLIMFHHSFEHIENPKETMLCAAQKLTPEGKIVISIPIAGSRAFRLYGEYWVQLDAPRHIFLHTTDSIRVMAESTGLMIEDVIYDSSAFQYVGSIQYRDGKDGNYRRTLRGIIQYAVLALFQYSRLAQEDNNARRGDQATFVLKPRGETDV